jgi:SH3-like domain-containing protein
MPPRCWIIPVAVLLAVSACTLIAPEAALTPNAATPAGTPIAATQTATPTPACRAVNDEVLALRVAADINADEVTILDAGTTTEVIGRTGRNTYWQVRTSLGREGWLDASATTLYGDCGAIPILSAATVTPAPTGTPDVPTIQVKVNLNVRRGPNILFAPPIGGFAQGDTAPILAVSSTGDWYKVRYDGGEGWVSAAAAFVDVLGDASGLPVESGPPVPTITPTPTDIPLTATPAIDPSTNFLQDPSFEGPYTGRGSVDVNIPAAWSFAFYDQPRNFDWQNLRPVAFPHRTAPEVRSGELSLNLQKDYATFTAVVYQQVTVPDDARVRASAWAWVHTCDPEPAICNSDPASGARMRLGLDPNGGTNPFSGSVEWSPFIAPHDSWGNIGTSAQVNGTSVTVFLYATQNEPRGLNRAYWDEAVLNVGG